MDVETFFVGASNCCDINVCHTSCGMIGHPTVYGWIVLIGLQILIVLIINTKD